MFKQIWNKGTINVLQEGVSAEYGQRPYFDHFIFWDPSLSDVLQFYCNLVATWTCNLVEM